MLVSKTAVVKWNSKNREYYTGKGYTFTKWKDDIVVSVEDLPQYSQTLVEVGCDYCGGTFPRKYSSYLQLKNNEFNSKDACQECRGPKYNETIKNKYNVDNIWQIDEIKQKQIKTNIEKFGTENPFGSEVIKDKIRKTNKERYGVESPLQNSEIYEKLKQTNVERYGCENVFQDLSIQEKYKVTMLKRYGVDHPHHIKGITEKVMIKKAKTLYLHSTTPVSKQQIYLHNLFGGELNYPVGSYNLDIKLEDNIYVEYDGGGHDLNVKLGQITQTKFDDKQIKRNYFLKNLGWKMIRLVSIKDYIPSDDIILKMIEEAKDYLEAGHSWIKFDVDSSKVITSQYEKDYEFGKLHRVSKNDLLNTM